MAQKVSTLITDDLDGTEASATIRFGLDGADYEIDLNEAHAQELCKTVEHYAAAARKVRAASAPRATQRRAKRSAAGPRSSEVREWAKAEGIQVKERGRVPAELIVKFQSAAGS